MFHFTRNRTPIYNSDNSQERQETVYVVKSYFKSADSCVWKYEVFGMVFMYSTVNADFILMLSEYILHVMYFAIHSVI